MEVVERASSRCGTPTFGSRVDLPSVAEARRARGGNATTPIQLRKPFGYGSAVRAYPAPPVPTTVATVPVLKQAAPIRGGGLKKNKPSPLSASSSALTAAPCSPSLPSPSVSASTSSIRSVVVTSPRGTRVSSPRHGQTPQPSQSPIARRSRTPFRTQISPGQSQSPVPPPPASPMSPRRRSSYAHLASSSPTTTTTTKKTLRHMPSSPILKQSLSSLQKPQPSSPPSPAPVPTSSRIPALMRRASVAQLQAPKPVLTSPPPPLPSPSQHAPHSISMLRSAGGSIRRMGSLLLPGRASGGALDFARARRKDDDESSDDDDDEGLRIHRPMSPGLLPVGSVLAEAARIERGHGHVFSRGLAGSPDY
ncbi:hypothetical protein C8F01DRAFT_1136357 [Mycena amicta]|nr:hypothetical protein C8F01DRAFT_1136357 [Mycena amicta]